MNRIISERVFEDAIECALLRHGPDECPGDELEVRELAASVWHRSCARRLPQAPAAGLRPQALLDSGRGCRLPSSHATERMEEAQAAPWRRREAALPRPAFTRDRSSGALDELRNGAKDSGCNSDSRSFGPRAGSTKSCSACTRPIFSAVVRQLRFNEQGEQSLDLALFLNGVPIFTAEFKNPLNGQDVEDAIHQ